MDALLKGLADIYLSCSSSWVHSYLSTALLHLYHPYDYDGTFPERLPFDQRYTDLTTFPLHTPLSEASKVRSPVPDLWSAAMVQIVCGGSIAEAHTHFILLLTYDVSRGGQDSLLLQKLKDINSMRGKKFRGPKQISADDQ